MRMIVLLLIASVLTIGHLVAADSEPVYLDPRHAASHPGTETELWHLSIERELTYAELYDLGVATFIQNKWERAASVFRLASGRTTEPAKKVACLLAASQALTLSNQTRKDRNLYLEAAQLTNEAQRWQPNNAKIAYYRRAAWTAASDGLEIQVAQGMIQRYQLKESGQEVLEPLSCVVIIAAAVTDVVAYLAYHEGWIDEKTAKEVLRTSLTISALAAAL